MSTAKLQLGDRGTGVSPSFLAAFDRSRGSWSRGFTLVELLATGAIVAILASLLLPALVRAKAAARTTECRNNLRTLGLALRIYANDFNCYPATDGLGIMGYGTKYGWLMHDDWKMALVPFVGLQDDQFPDREAVMRVLRCPQLVSNPDGRRGQGQYALNASGTAPFKAAANLGLGGYGPRLVQPTAESAVRAPADLIAVGDIAPGPTEGEMFRTSGYFDVCSANPWLLPGTSHRGGANMLLADGHVESARQTNWAHPSEPARARWNNDHEPHPETWKR